MALSFVMVCPSMGIKTRSRQPKTEPTQPVIHIIPHDCWLDQPMLAGKMRTKRFQRGQFVGCTLILPRFLPSFCGVPPGFPQWHSRLQHLLRAGATLQCGAAGARWNPTCGAGAELREVLVLPGKRQLNAGEVPKGMNTNK